MKKIIHITPGNPIGGLDIIVQRILNSLTNFANIILYWNSGGGDFFKNLKTFKVFKLGYKGNNVFINLFGQLKRLNDSDIIHVHNTDVWVLFSPLSFFGHKTVYSLHTNFGVNIKKSFIENLVISLIINYISLFSRKIILLTKGQRNNLVKYSLFKKTFFKKSKIINNFIDKETILSRNKINYNSDIIFVGRYTSLKGFEDLIQLAKELPSIKINLVGDGSYKPNLKNVSNIGVVPNKDLPKYYDQNSIFILPSYTEAFPMTILEAMARGLVILTSNIPGMKEIVKEGRNGYLFNSGDITKMKEIILYLKNNPDEIKRISANNLEDIMKFTSERQVKKYMQVYKEILQEGKHA